MVEVRSAAMAGGYWRGTQDQAAAFADGWFRSGDMAFTDSDGYFHYLGRAVDLAATGGVPLTELEDTACRQPDVRYAIAVPGDSPGEIIVAVVPWPGQDVSVDACHQALDAAHRTAAGERTIRVTVVDRAPVTEQGKPDRAALRRLSAITHLGRPLGSHQL